VIGLVTAGAFLGVADRADRAARFVVFAFAGPFPVERAQ